MALELDCKIISKLPVQSGKGSRGEWQKQEFIVEYRDGNFPSQVCMSVWGADKVSDLGNFKVGDQVKVSFNISSREFNGRWYTDVRAWKMVQAQSTAKAAVEMPVQAVEEDLPSASIEEDDLPF